MELRVHHDAAEAGIVNLVSRCKRDFTGSRQCHILVHCLEHGESLVAVYHRNNHTGVDELEVLDMDERCK